VTTGWVRAFDDSFQRVPVKNYPAMYAAGFRVMAGYVAGGSSDKWITTSEIKAWFAQGDDTGLLPLFEAVGNEPVTSPGSGDDHARAARAGCRARDIPDTSVISPAMDRNVSMADARGPIKQYMQAWNSADTMPPLPYIELDAGAYLFAVGATSGTGTPAAYSWDPSNELVTPDNAPPHVMWTQEHNGVSDNGGNYDSGHARLTAPIYWKKVPDMPLDATDLANISKAVWAATPPAGSGNGDVIPNDSPFVVDSPAHTPPGANTTTGAAYAVGRIRTLTEATLPQLATDVAALQATLADLETKLDAILAAISTPPPVVGGTIHVAGDLTVT
jgi:hypothetical protein